MGPHYAALSHHGRGNDWIVGLDIWQPYQVFYIGEEQYTLLSWRSPPDIAAQEGNILIFHSMAKEGMKCLLKKNHNLYTSFGDISKSDLEPIWAFFWYLQYNLMSFYLCKEFLYLFTQQNNWKLNTGVPIILNWACSQQNFLKLICGSVSCISLLDYKSTIGSIYFGKSAILNWS